MCWTEPQTDVAGFQDVLLGVTVLLMSQSKQAAGVGRAQREQESCVHTPQDYSVLPRVKVTWSPGRHRNPFVFLTVFH